MISIVIPALNRSDLTRNCVKTIRANTDVEGVELVLVDNASTDDTPGLYEKFDIVVRNHRNLGFGRACNQGAAVSSGATFVFLNNDTEVTYRWLPPLAAAAEQYGVAGAKLLYPDGTVQHAGVDVFVDHGLLTAANRGRGEPDEGFDQEQEVAAVTGACLAVRRDVFAYAGGFDLGYWNGYEDVDLCLKAKQLGYSVRFVPESVVVHLESASGPERWSRVNENVRRLQDKWRKG